MIPPCVVGARERKLEIRGPLTQTKNFGRILLACHLCPLHPCHIVTLLGNGSCLYLFGSKLSCQCWQTALHRLTRRQIPRFLQFRALVTGTEIGIVMEVEIVTVDGDAVMT